MPGRKYSSSAYLYSFNGKPKDDEISGDGNTVDLGERMLDTRLVRLKSLDPRTRDYPWNSPYALAENRPIDGIDKNGEGWDDIKKYVNNKASQILQATATIAVIATKQYVQSKVNEVHSKIVAVKSLFIGDQYNRGVAGLKKLAHGIQPYGLNIYNSDGVPSPAADEIKGKAEIVDDLDLKGMVIPQVLGRGIQEEIGKLGKVNEDVKAVSDAVSKSAEITDKVKEGIEKTQEAMGGEKLEDKKTDSCTVCHKTGTEDEMKTDKFHGNLVKTDTKPKN